jgi:hypothetical protein
VRWLTLAAVFALAGCGGHDDARLRADSAGHATVGTDMLAFLHPSSPGRFQFRLPKLDLLGGSGASAHDIEGA